MALRHALPIVLKRWLRRWVTWRAAAIFFAALAILPWVFIFEENWRGNRAWETYRKEAEGQGERFDVFRLVPPPVPIARNFASTPYLAPIFTFSSNDLGEYPKQYTNVIEDIPHIGYITIRRATNLARLLPRLRYVSSKSSIAADLQPGWYFGDNDALLESGQAFVPSNEPPLTKIASAAKIILDDFKPFEPTLEELRISARLPSCRFDVPYEHWINPKVPMAVAEQCQIIRGLFRIINLDANAKLETGQSDIALCDLDIMFRLDDGLKDEPLVSAQMVRVSGLSILLHTVGQGLAENRWSDTALRQLQTALQGIDVLTPMERAWHGKRDICLNQPFDGGNKFPDGFQGNPAWLEALFLPGWARMEQVNLNRSFQESVFPRIDLTTRTVPPSANRRIDQRLRAEQTSLIETLLHHSFFASFLIPEYARMARLAAYSQTETDLAMLACTLERYRESNHSYPDNLAQLVPQYLTRLPHDVINGEPLKYRKTSSGKFLLYSVGWDGKDDGGEVAPYLEGLDVPLQGDWAWRYAD